MKVFQTEALTWIHPPQKSVVTPEKVVITTDPHTDYWQRTYYGFCNDNAHTLVMSLDEPYFSFTVRTEFASKTMYDQCGVVVYQDSENWIKASVEYENEQFQRLGSVVTNHGYSDWASVDIPAEIKAMYYRLSRRESDFCVEQSMDGKEFHQMRIAHLFEGAGTVRIGLYACSPGDSSFDAVFTQMKLGACQWELHT